MPYFYLQLNYDVKIRHSNNVIDLELNIIKHRTILFQAFQNHG